MIRPELYIRESNLIEDIDDNAEDRQSFKAWLFLKDVPFLTIDVLKELHRMITLNQLPVGQRGVLRSELKVNVTIGGKVAPQWYLSGHMLNNWIMDYSQGAKSPIDAHLEYEHIHPWIDGNGRTGRMLYWWHCRKAKVEPILFTNENKYEEYYPLFK